MSATPAGRERGEAFLQRFLSHASSAPDLISAWTDMMSADCRIHWENGEVVDVKATLARSGGVRTMFPDMMVQIDRVLYPADRVVLQLSVNATMAMGFPVFGAGDRIRVRAAMVARPNEALELDEVWSYFNPGFPFTLPPSGLTAAAPLHDGASDDEASTLFQSWTSRARGADGSDLVSALAESFAPDGVVHLGNGDSGGAHLLPGLFEFLMTGLPDLSVDIEDVQVGDGHLITQFRMSGTHTGALGPYQPTGRVLPSRGMLIARPNRNGQVAELWVYVAPVFSISFPPRN